MMQDYGVDPMRWMKTIKVMGECLLCARTDKMFTDESLEHPPRKGGGKLRMSSGMISKLKELGAL